MHASLDGWAWLWMSFMMVFWIVLIGAVVFAAVRLAQRPREGKLAFMPVLTDGEHVFAYGRFSEKRLRKALAKEYATEPAR